MRRRHGESTSEGSFAALSIIVFGVGLFRRMLPLSRDTAWAALFLHAMYLEPQVAKMLWVPAVESYPNTCTPWHCPRSCSSQPWPCSWRSSPFERPKPSARQLARRETELRESVRPNEARLLVVDGRIDEATDSAQQMFGNITGQPLRSVFAGDAFAAFEMALRSNHETRIDHRTLLVTIDDSHCSAHLVVERMRPGAGAHDPMWISIEASTTRLLRTAGRSSSRRLRRKRKSRLSRPC